MLSELLVFWFCSWDSQLINGLINCWFSGGVIVDLWKWRRDEFEFEWVLIRCEWVEGMNEVLFAFIVVNCGANCGETERVVGDGGLYLWKTIGSKKLV